jgi:hypothetical protein
MVLKIFTKTDPDMQLHGYVRELQRNDLLATDDALYEATY